MKNKITLVVLLISVILLVFFLIEGIKIGNFEILSISQMIQKNNDLEERIQLASSRTSIDYPQAIQRLEETYEKHEIQKEKYEQLSGLAEGSKEEIYETKQYDIGYLWKIIGKYATTRKLNLGIDVQKTNGQDLYNLNFNVSGQYANTIQFISDLENNSDLSFRIYNFRMTGNGEEVFSTFTVKDVNIDPYTTIGTSNVQTTIGTQETGNNNVTE